MLSLLLMTKLVLFAVLLQAGCASGNRMPQSTPVPATNEAGPSPGPSIRIFALQQTAVNENLRITILDFGPADGEAEHSPPPQTRWMLFEVEVEVLAGEPIEIEFVLLDVDGNPYERTDVPERTADLLQPLPAGYAGQGAVAFVVPDSDLARHRPDTLLYGDGTVTWALQLGMPRPGN